ncbi:MAG: hypothetical protein H0W99_05885 [Acidobacteria bacterium]|nr:hypothetical protein [Acidobacteriota bacterium]
MSKFGALKSSKKAVEEKTARPLAKRNDPEYEQVSVYLRIDTHADAAAKLKKERRGKEDRRDFSELVEGLLRDWLNT